ncbi:hypothetical protein GCM10017161_28700 [Thalassotalea marina]|uniref:histidine kinase n=2 Tax=Thalassotalea marina TaxID=1673741 RepID=A0A919BN23_9GAMM|nr:hypothetical protein GCM10017161_28700 [Thalassotalea marina]
MLMTTSSLEAFFNSNYMPHGHCYLWQPHILWSHVVADFVIAVSYFSLPVAIILFALKRKDIGENKLFYLFSSFILFCGITHLIGILTIWHGIYGIHAISKILTAMVSLVTAIYVYKLIPTAIAIPTLSQYKNVKQQLFLEQAQSNTLRSKLDDFKFSQFMLDSMPVGALVLDKNCTSIYSNKTFEQYFCQDIDGVAVTLLDALPNDAKEQLLQYCSTATGVNQSAFFISTTYQINKHSIIPIELTATASQFEQHVYIVVTLKSIEEINEFKDKLALSYKKLERAVSATEDGIWEWYVTDDTVSYSKQLLTLIGKPDIEQPRFEDWFSHIHPDYQLRVENAIEEHFRTKEKYIVEYLGKDKQGKYSWFISIGDSEFDHNGDPIVMSGSLRNINYAKELEKKYQENAEFLNAIYEGNSHAIWVLALDENKDYIYHVFNDTACRWLGTNKEEVIGKNLHQLTGTVFPIEIAKNLRHNYNRCLLGGAKVDYIEHIAFGEVNAWFNTTLYPIYDSHGEINFIVGTAIDITAEKASEQALSHHKEVLEKVLNSVVCGLYIFSFESAKNTTINARYTEILGYTLDELNNFADIYSLFHPDDISLVKEHMSAVSSSISGELFYLKYRFKHKSGHWIWCYSADRILNYNSKGEPVEMLGTFIDITDEVSLMQQLKDSNEYLERFAFVASHDLQEPLRKIMAFSEALSQRLSDKLKGDEDATFELSRLHSAAHRMQKMINDVLKLSRINYFSLHLQKTTVKSLFDVVSDVLSLQIEQSAASIKLKGELTEIVVDVSLMEQVLQNLLSNALKFCKESRKPEILIEVKTTAQGTTISIQDNGIGIDEQFCEKIFEPFKRLHGRQAYEGSGIGLAICRQAIKIHGGKISCFSKKGEGTTMVIELPLT